MANNRIYFANQQLIFRRDGSNATTSDATNRWTAAHGVQSVAVTTTFNLEQAFELGQLAIYENIEGVPDIEVTATKVLDGYPLLYHLATQGNNSSPTLAGRSAEKCIVGIGIWPDVVDSVGQAGNTTPQQQMEMSGMFASSVSYNFPTEDNFTEDITLVGNNKGWTNSACDTQPWTFTAGNGASGEFPGNNDVPMATGTNKSDEVNNPADTEEVAQLGGVNRRENLKFKGSTTADAGGKDYTKLPSGIPDVDDNGWMNPKSSTANAHLQSISVSTDLGREELFELGTRQPYARIVTFPVEVTCDIEVLSVSGDMIDAYADGCTNTTAACEGVKDNLKPEEIRIATCEGTIIYLGTQNKLSSVSYGGGDAGGGNVTVTYSYSTFNDFTVLHPQDMSNSGAYWWKNREDYVTSS